MELISRAFALYSGISLNSHGMTGTYVIIFINYSAMNNLDEIVPVSFVTHFHASTGIPRKHQLYPMLKALLLQRIFFNPDRYAPDCVPRVLSGTS